MYGIYQYLLPGHHRRRIDFCSFYCGNLHSKDDRYVPDCKDRFFPVFLQLSLCRTEHFFLLHVHSIFRRENFSDHLLCEDICSDCDQYPDPSTDPWSKRSLALGSDRRMYDAFSFPLFYSEKSTPLSLHPKTGLKYRSKIDLPSCCGSCLVCHSNLLDHRLILSFHCSILIF